MNRHARIEARRSAAAYTPPPAGALTPRARHSGAASPPMGHDFGTLPVHDGATKKMSIDADPNPPSSTSGNVTKGITASGSGTVNVHYAPEATDTSTKIVFIQVMREYLDGVAVKPSEVFSGAHEDPDTTADFYHVDYFSGEADPYYNGDDAADGGTQGKATAPTVTATMSDGPEYQDHWFPAGKTKLKWEFRTIAFSAAGADKGKYYAYAKWFYEKEKGSAGKTRHDGTSTETALPASKAAIKLWCSNHGFNLPT